MERPPPSPGGEKDGEVIPPSPSPSVPPIWPQLEGASNAGATGLFPALFGAYTQAHLNQVRPLSRSFPHSPGINQGLLATANPLLYPGQFGLGQNARPFLGPQASGASYPASFYNQFNPYYPFRDFRSDQAYLNALYSAQSAAQLSDSAQYLRALAASSAATSSHRLQHETPAQKKESLEKDLNFLMPRKPERERERRYSSEREKMKRNRMDPYLSQLLLRTAQRPGPSASPAAPAHPGPSSSSYRSPPVAHSSSPADSALLSMMRLPPETDIIKYTSSSVGPKVPGTTNRGRKRTISLDPTMDYLQATATEPPPKKFDQRSEVMSERFSVQPGPSTLPTPDDTPLDLCTKPKLDETSQRPANIHYGYEGAMDNPNRELTATEMFGPGLPNTPTPLIRRKPYPNKKRYLTPTASPICALSEMSQLVAEASAPGPTEEPATSAVVKEEEPIFKEPRPRNLGRGVSKPKKNTVASLLALSRAGVPEEPPPSVEPPADARNPPIPTPEDNNTPALIEERSLHAESAITSGRNMDIGTIAKPKKMWASMSDKCLLRPSDSIEPGQNRQASEQPVVVSETPQKDPQVKAEPEEPKPKESGKEMRRQHTVLVKMLEMRGKAEEKEKKRIEAKAEKIARIVKKLADKRRDMELLEEIKRPREDLELDDLIELPPFKRVPGLKLAAKCFADLLFIYEFLLTFGETLGFDMNSLPTLNALQEAFLKDEVHEEELLSVLTHLLVCVVEDPGIANPARFVTLLGQSLKQAAFTNTNISELLRIYLYAASTAEVKALSGLSLERDRDKKVTECHNLYGDEAIAYYSGKNLPFYQHLRENQTFKLAELLKEKPYLALNPTAQAAMITVTINELMNNRAVAAQIEKSQANASAAKKQLSSVQQAIRELRVNFENSNHRGFLEDTAPKEKGKTEGKQTELSDEDPHEEIDSESDSASHPPKKAKHASTDGMKIYLESLLAESRLYQQNIIIFNSEVRATCLGQDRYYRRYFWLPKARALFVEGMESGQSDLYEALDLAERETASPPKLEPEPPGLPALLDDVSKDSPPYLEFSSTVEQPLSIPLPPIMPRDKKSPKSKNSKDTRFTPKPKAKQVSFHPSTSKASQKSSPKPTEPAEKPFKPTPSTSKDSSVWQPPLPKEPFQPTPSTSKDSSAWQPPEPKEPFQPTPSTSKESYWKPPEPKEPFQPTPSTSKESYWKPPEPKEPFQPTPSTSKESYWKPPEPKEPFQPTPSTSKAHPELIWRPADEETFQRSPSTSKESYWKPPEPKEPFQPTPSTSKESYWKPPEPKEPFQPTPSTSKAHPELIWRPADEEIFQQTTSTSKDSESFWKPPESTEAKILSSSHCEGMEWKPEEIFKPIPSTSKANPELGWKPPEPQESFGPSMDTRGTFWNSFVPIASSSKADPDTCWKLPEPPKTPMASTSGANPELFWKPPEPPAEHVFQRPPPRMAFEPLPSTSKAHTEGWKPVGKTFKRPQSHSKDPKKQITLPKSDDHEFKVPKPKVYPVEENPLASLIASRNALEACRTERERELFRRAEQGVHPFQVPQNISTSDMQHQGLPFNLPAFPGQFVDPSLLYSYMQSFAIAYNHINVPLHQKVDPLQLALYPGIYNSFNAPLGQQFRPFNYPDYLSPWYPGHLAIPNNSLNTPQGQFAGQFHLPTLTSGTQHPAVPFNNLKGQGASAFQLPPPVPFWPPQHPATHNNLSASQGQMASAFQLPQPVPFWPPQHPATHNNLSASQGQMASAFQLPQPVPFWPPQHSATHNNLSASQGQMASAFQLPPPVPFWPPQHPATHNNLSASQGQMAGAFQLPPPVPFLLPEPVATLNNLYASPGQMAGAFQLPPPVAPCPPEPPATQNNLNASPGQRKSAFKLFRPILPCPPEPPATQNNLNASPGQRKSAFKLFRPILPCPPGPPATQNKLNASPGQRKRASKLPRPVPPCPPEPPASQNKLNASPGQRKSAFKLFRPILPCPPGPPATQNKLNASPGQRKSAFKLPRPVPPCPPEPPATQSKLNASPGQRKSAFELFRSVPPCPPEPPATQNKLNASPGQRKSAFELFRPVPPCPPEPPATQNKLNASPGQMASASKLPRPVPPCPPEPPATQNKLNASPGQRKRASKLPRPVPPCPPEPPATQNNLNASPGQRKRASKLPRPVPPCPPEPPATQNNLNASPGQRKSAFKLFRPILPCPPEPPATQNNLNASPAQNAGAFQLPLPVPFLLPQPVATLNNLYASPGQMAGAFQLPPPVPFLLPEPVGTLNNLNASQGQKAGAFQLPQPVPPCPPEPPATQNNLNASLGQETGSVQLPPLVPSTLLEPPATQNNVNSSPGQRASAFQLPITAHNNLNASQGQRAGAFGSHPIISASDMQNPAVPFNTLDAPPIEKLDLKSLMAKSGIPDDDNSLLRAMRQDFQAKISALVKAHRKKEKELFFGVVRPSGDFSFHQVPHSESQSFDIIPKEPCDRRSWQKKCPPSSHEKLKFPRVGGLPPSPGPVPTFEGVSLVLTPEDALLLEKAKARGPEPPPVMKPIPIGMRLGWWRIYGLDTIKKLIAALNPRGIRERELKRNLTKMLDVFELNKEKLEENHEPDDLDLDLREDPRIQFVMEGVPAPDVPGSWDDAVITRVQMCFVEQLESLEDKVTSASMQVKTWIPPTKLSEEMRKNVMSKPCFLAAAKQRLLDLGAAIERRYLKPPLGTASSEGGVHVVDQEQVTKGLCVWKDAIHKSHTTAQLGLSLNMLESCIAWDKSIMKANCQFCLLGDNEDQLLLCDGCDKGYHMYCFKPKIDTVPEGDWFCIECRNRTSGEKNCIVCGDTPFKNLYQCQYCPRVYHGHCLTPPPKGPRNKWSCLSCSLKIPRKKCGRKLGWRKNKDEKAVEKTTDRSGTSGQDAMPGPSGLAKKRPADEDISGPSAVKKTKIDPESSDDENLPLAEVVENRQQRAALLKQTAESAEAAQTPKVIPQAGGQKSALRKSRTKRHNEDMAKCKAILDDLINHEDAAPFLTAVNPKSNPTYRMIVKDPIDLAMITAKFEKDSYSTKDDFAEDVRRMFDNCRTFNIDASYVGKAGLSLRVYFEMRWNETFPNSGRMRYL